MKKKKTKGGPYKSVADLKKRFFPNLFNDERPNLVEEETNSIAVALGNNLARRIRRALR